MLANTYGIAMPARMDIEAQILARQKRLPGLPSSNFGAEILTNDVDRFGFESYLDNPADREDAPRRDLHAAMELKLGMDKTPGVRAGREAVISLGGISDTIIAWDPNACARRRARVHPQRAST